ncbi:unnamed protein product [Amoebophrya sp. A25]|nr:unnamed protein product [Amoebophrya sp. A25]|eukprot:GSA25T00015339001.1
MIRIREMPFHACLLHIGIPFFPSSNTDKINCKFTSAVTLLPSAHAGRGRSRVVHSHLFLHAPFAVQYGRDASSTLSAFTDGVAMLGTLFLTPCCAAVQSRLGFVALFGLLASLLSVGTLLSVQYYRDLAEQVVSDGATDEKVSEAGHDAALIQQELNATGTARL